MSNVAALTAMEPGVEHRFLASIGRLFTPDLHLVAVVLAVVVSHFLLRNEWLRNGWNIALQFWKRRPKGYSPNFPIYDLSWIPGPLPLRFEKWTRAREAERTDRRVPVVKENLVKEKPGHGPGAKASTAPPAQKTSRSEAREERIRKVIEMGSRYYGGGVSVQQLVEEAGPIHKVRALTVADLTHGLHSRADAIEVWQRFSGDMKKTSGWYFEKSEDGEKWIVGRVTDARTHKFDDPMTACADYIYGYLHSLPQR